MNARGARQPDASAYSHCDAVRAELRLDPPSQTLGDSAAPAARDDRSAAADEAHHLLELRVGHRDDGVQHGENCRPARAGGCNVVEFRPTPLRAPTELGEDVVQRLAAPRTGEEGRGAEIQ